MLLPGRDLTNQETDQLIAFLEALTDRCIVSASCIGDWVPTLADDPDGHLLTPEISSAPQVADVVDPSDYPSGIDIEWPVVPSRDNFSDVVDCENGLSTASNLGVRSFEVAGSDFGLTETHGFSPSTWTDSSTLEFAMIAGGLSATHLNDDCWPDIVFAGGDASGMVAYLNRGGQSGFYRDDARLAGTRTASEYARFTGVASADLDGDYRRELVLGNLYQGDVVLLTMNEGGLYEEAARLPMTRNTYGISFGDIDRDGYLDMFTAHWDFLGVEGSAPVLWRNNQALVLQPYDAIAGISTDTLNQKWNFTPKFIDLQNTGLADLLISSDFGTSAVLRNAGGSFDLVTDTAVFDDENGMGGAIGDVNNDGLADWFVTSILDPDGDAEANWGTTGNRLYINRSTDSEIVFENATSRLGVSDGNWGWGACMADFNHDGLLDIFHVNGFGYIPPEVASLDDRTAFRVARYADIASEFINVSPRLFINNGHGFDESSSSWGVDIPSEGRGIVCFDYDRDGDIDIGLVDHSSGIQFFENQIGSGGMHRFLNIRLVGAPPNTDAIGAKVVVTANVGGDLGIQRQTRWSEANSNFNSQNAPDIHFGLGGADLASILVVWPNGTAFCTDEVATNQFIIIDQRSSGGDTCSTP